MNLKKTLYGLFLFCTTVQVKSQISVTNINIQSFNIVPEALLNVGIMNSDKSQEILMITQIFNAANQNLIMVKSDPFLLKSGLNAYSGNERRVATTNYGQGNQADYLKSAHSLPSGRYRICVSLFPLNGADKIDDYCDELEAEFNQYLYLVNPLDRDTIDTKYPILMWTHNEPFSILNQGEFYRMVVTEVKKNQTAEEAITINSPTMVRNYLNDHQLLYPFDAKELKEGSSYAWQVQKLSDGVIVNKTESWIFNLKNDIKPQSLKYVALKEKPDGAYYTAYDGKVYFKYGEEYKSTGKLNFLLKDKKGKAIQIETVKDNEKSISKSLSPLAQLKNTGSNYYSLDIDEKNLGSGYYTLEVRNEKNEIFFLKILLP